MKRSLRMVVVAALIAVPTAVIDSPMHISAEDIGDSQMSQSDWDKVATANEFAGLWGDTSTGVEGRPYVTELSVSVAHADGSAPTTRTIVTGGTVSTPLSTTAGDLGVILSPTNVCNKAKGQTPKAGECYADPNRISYALVYSKGPRDQNGPVTYGTNLSVPTDNSRNPITSNSLLNEIKADGNTTTVDMTINMNTWGKALRWTWINGQPIAWSVTPPGDPAALVHLKFILTTGPSQMCDSRIPVEGCDPSNRGANFNPIKTLLGTGIFSVDETGVDQIFAGSLFASVNADMGSLEAQPVGSPKLALTYAVSGMSELSGAPNVARFFAFVSDTSLANYFGVTPDILNAPEFATSETLSVTRADRGVSETTSWTRWTSETNLTSGYFLTVEGVQFNGKKVETAGVHASAQKKTYPAKFVMGKKVSNRVNVRKVGGRQVLALSSSTKVCRAAGCRWVVSKSKSKLSSKMTRLTTVNTRTGSATASVTAKKGTLLSVVLQAKVKGKWKFITSRMVIAK